MISHTYGVASVSRINQIIGLFCKGALQKRLYSAKETYNFKEPTNRSHPIAGRGGAARLIYILEVRLMCILEVQEVYFGDITEDIIKHQTLNPKP